MAVTVLIATAAACSRTHPSSSPATSTSGPVVATTATVPSTTAALPAVRPFAVTTASVTLVDASRPTPATSAGPARPTRTLPTTLWIPTGAPGPVPLVVWAHGFNRLAADYGSLLSRWASAGYVVAAPRLPSSRRPSAGEGPASEADGRAEAGDLSFAVGEIVRMSTAGTKPVAGRVDGGHVIVAGHSDGAIDALAVGFAACCRDARVSAVVSIAGDESPAVFGAYGSGGRPVPVLIEQGDHDMYNSLSIAQSLYAGAGAPKFLLILRGTDHNTSVLDVAQPPARLLADVVVGFSDRYTKGAATLQAMSDEARASSIAEFTHQE